jgi:hypothetical protein
MLGCGSSSPVESSGAAGGTVNDTTSSGAGGFAGSDSANGDAAAAGGSQTTVVGSDAASLDDFRAPDAGAAPIPTRDEYLKTLYQLSDLLLSTQITKTDPAYGALVSPSTNPDNQPIHSRGAEAVYPFAVAFKYSQNAKYADAAVLLGNWLTTVQNAAGAWVEEWPATSGWDGTTADQLISMAGAYAILKSRLSAQENGRWVDSITKAADFVQTTFPKGNINYTPTGAVALVMASQALPSPKAGWLTKAASLMDATLQSINADNFITGEGSGVDLGYNIAQTIGYIAMYGRILPSPTHVDRAASLLKTHDYFMYPNGAIDNSWGTRTYKWTLESGTKTAPGVYFSFALLADKDPSFQRGAQLALAFLRDQSLNAKGWVAYGPHAARHPTSDPPSNYSTFARAQSIATAVELGPSPAEPGNIWADNKNWFKYFPTLATGVTRTDKIMATVSAYGAIGTYARETLVRGGSVSALWFEGYGPTGFLQVSSQTIYARVEPLHMPIEATLLPLTPRIETSSGTYYTNVYDDKATLSMSAAADGTQAISTGALKSATGAASGTTFSWSYQFGKDFYTKEVTVSSATNIRIVEPFVDNTGNQYEVQGTDTLKITAANGGVWQVKVVSSTGAYELAAGEDRAKYWSPFPGIDCYPLVFKLSGAGSSKIKYTVSQVH